MTKTQKIFSMPSIYVDQQTGEILPCLDKVKYKIVETKPHYKQKDGYTEKTNYVYCEPNRQGWLIFE